MGKKRGAKGLDALREMLRSSEERRAAKRAGREARAAPKAEAGSGGESDGGDSGYDTDDLISYARKSGGMKSKPARAGKRARESDDAKDRIEVDFTFFDPRPDDYHGVKILLRPFAVFGDSRTPFDAEGLADAVSAQASVGSMIKNEGGEEQPLGFASVVSLHRHADAAWARQVRSLVESKAPPRERKLFRAAFANTARPLGLYLNVSPRAPPLAARCRTPLTPPARPPADPPTRPQERLVNVPLQLVPDLHAAVLQDVAWAAENEITDELRAACRFHCVVLVSRLFFNRDTAEMRIEQSRAKRQRKGGSSGGGAAAAAADAQKDPEGGEGQSFYQWEAEHFESVATANFRFERAAPESGAGIAQAYSVSLVPFAAFSAAVASLPRDEGSGA